MPDSNGSNGSTGSTALLERDRAGAPGAQNGNAALKERPIGDLVKQASEQAALLARQEVELAKAELEIKAKQAGLGAGMFGAAGIVGLFALGAAVAGGILALATAVAPWLAALIAAAALVLVAGVLALVGKTRVQRAVPPMPEQATASVRDDVQTAKTAVQEGRK